MAKVLIFPEGCPDLPQDADRDDRRERRHQEAVSPGDRLTRARNELQRELGGTILLLDFAVFRLRTAVREAGTLMPQEKLTKELEALDVLLDTTRASVRKI